MKPYFPHLVLFVIAFILNNLAFAADEKPRLFKPSTIRLVTLNDKKTHSSLSFLSRNQGTELQPGTNTLELYYEQLLQLSADDHEVVKSAPIKITFDAALSNQYTISHKEITKLKDAKNFANSPEFIIKNQDGIIIAFSNTIASVAPTKLFKTDDTDLKKLQSDWKNTDNETRTRFIEWVNSEKNANLNK
ncbi:MAG: DUF2057 family protein [Gammaproteobacteria bacterium]|nr:DUF2057 family protein [Gammaproteobacteria bacterium]